MVGCSLTRLLMSTIPAQPPVPPPNTSDVVARKKLIEVVPTIQAIRDLREGKRYIMGTTSSRYRLHNVPRHLVNLSEP